MSYDLLAWNAWARNATPDEIAEKLTQQQAEVARLRSVCRISSERLANVQPYLSSYRTAYSGVCDVIFNLREAGKEAGR